MKYFMTIKEYKMKFAELHKEMKEEYGFEELDMFVIDQKITLSGMYPECSRIETQVVMNAR